MSYFSRLGFHNALPEDQEIDKIYAVLNRHGSSE